MTQKKWKKEEISALYHRPLFPLLSEAHVIHREHHTPGTMQVCALISYKTGGCTEDCAYCPQAARYQTTVTPLPLMQETEMLAQAERAIAGGATRVCLGAAWREVRSGKAFETILSVVRKLSQRDVEVCCTLGMLTAAQAAQLKKAGLTAYNHNLDSSRDFYSEIITTREYDDRLLTLKRVVKAGLVACCGAILGMGERAADRIALIHTLSQLAPESVPLNFLTPIPGTPLEKRPPLPIWEMLRMIATMRLVLPKAKIRLSAGRLSRSIEEQALCFFAGANALFSGEKLLTTPNPSFDDDAHMFELLGLSRETNATTDKSTS